MSKLKKLNKLNKSKTLSVALAVGLVASNLVGVAPAFAATSATAHVKSIANSIKATTSTVVNTLAPKDLKVTITTANVLKGITMGKTVVPFTLEDSVVTIEGTELSKLKSGSLKFDFESGSDKTLHITVTSKTATIPKSATFNNKNAKGKNVTVTMNTYGLELEEILNGTTPLDPDTDYTVGTLSSSGSAKVTINASYLSTLKNETNNLTFNFAGGIDPVLAVKVSYNTEAPAVTVKSVSAISDINVDNGTELADVNLPETVDVTTSTGTKTVNVTWNAGTPAYSATIEGAYVFSGTLTMPAGVTNPDSLMATATVNVAAAPLVDVDAPTIDTVGSVVTNYQTLTVPFSEKVAGTPVVTVNTVAEPAENVALATDGMSMTITKTAGFAPGGYAIVVNGLTDVAGNAMAANAAVSITKAASYVADFAFTTTALDATAGNHKVYFNALDQYGQNLNSGLSALDDAVVGTGTMGQLPLVISAKGDGENFITITDNLIAATPVTVTLTNTVNAVNYTKSKTYTVGTAAAPVPTSVAVITPAVGANITVDDDNQALTLTVLDQYGNPVTAGSVGNVRWVTSNKAVLAFNGNTAADFETTNNTLANNLDALTPGTATISVFLAGSTTPNATLQVSVGMSALSTLSWANAWDQTFNQEVSTEKLTPNSGAVVTAANLKYVVDSFPVGASASDIALTFADGTDADAGKILVKATTAKIGTYTFRVYTGATPAAGVVSGTRTLTTTINGTVASTTVADLTANELTAGTTVKKAITFKNVHGEVVSVNAQAISVASTSNMAVTAYDAADNALTIGSTATPVATLGFTGSAAGTDSVTIVTGAISKSLTLTTAAAATLTNFNLGSASASVIDSDTYDVGDATALDNVMIDNGLNTVVLIPISFSDQYGNAMTVNAGDFDMLFTGTTPGTVPTLALYGDKVDGTTALADNAATAVKYVGIKAPAGATTQTVTLQMRNNADTVNIGTSKPVAVTVNAARALASVSATPTVGNSVVNVPVAYTLSGIDQYGVAVNLDHNNTQLQTLSNVAIGNKAANGTDGKKSDFTLTASAAGSYSATVFYSADGTLDAGEKSATVSLTTGTIANIVNRIEIQPTVTVAGSAASADGTYNASTAKVALDGADADQTATFTVKAYDASNNEVGISQTSDVLYTVLSNSITNAPTITFTNNVATINMGSTFDADDSFTIQAMSLNGKTSSLVVNVADIDTAAAKSGQYYLASTATGTTALNTLAVDQSATVHVVGVNQFGKAVNVNESTAAVLASVQDDSTKIANERTAAGINIDAKATGSTTLRVMLADGSQLVLPVTVATVDTAGPVLADTITQNGNATTIKLTVTEPFGAYIGATKVNTSADSKATWNITGANASDVATITVASDLTGGGLITIVLTTAAGAAADGHVAKIDLAQIKDLAGNALVNGTTAANKVLTLTGGAATWTAALGES